MPIAAGDPSYRTVRGILSAGAERDQLPAAAGDGGAARSCAAPRRSRTSSLCPLAANVVHGLGHGPAGAIVAAWPAIALVGSYELLMVIIRSAQAPAGTAPGPGASGAPGDDPFQAQAAEEFAGEVAAGRVPSVRVIRARLHVGQPRA